MKIINSLEQGSPEWLQIRGNHLTGTDAAKVISILWADGDALKKQIAQILQAKQNSTFKGNYYTERGHRLEPANRYIYTQVKGVEVSTPGFIISDEYSIAGYSPDGIVMEGETPIGLLECKAFNEVRHKKNYEYAELGIFMQMQWGMFVTGLPWCDLSLYNPDLDDDSEKWLVKRYKSQQNVQENFKKVISRYCNLVKNKL